MLSVEQSTHLRALAYVVAFLGKEIKRGLLASSLASQ